MTKRKTLPSIKPSIHTLSISGFFHSKYLQNQIYNAMTNAVNENRYKQTGKNSIVKCGGGLQLILGTIRTDDYYVIINDINLPRLSGNDSYLALTDLSASALEVYEQTFEQELAYLGIPFKTDDIIFSLRRLDLTQDFYVKSDPSLTIRILRFAGETGLYHGFHPKHYNTCNEKHSARWESRWYNLMVYDKHAEIKNRDQKYHNVPDSDLIESKNRLRYEISLNREFLRRFERTVHIQEEREHFSISDGIQLYLDKLAPYIPTILRSIASDLFGDNNWQRVAFVQDELDFARKVGTIDEKAYRITQDYLNSLNDPESSVLFQLTTYKESIVREVLDQLEVNRVIIPDRILNQRELKRFPCMPLARYVTEPGESIDVFGIPKRPWKKSQRISRSSHKSSGNDSHR